MGRRTSNAGRLGIQLNTQKEEELFKWFLACLLFGKPIQTEIAEQAWRTLVAARLTNPEAILRAGWDKLVRLLDEAHYVRYDFSTATKLLEVCEQLKERYGTLTNLLAQARTASELSSKLQELKHVGPVTAGIFLREVSPIRYRRSTRGDRSRARLDCGHSIGPAAKGVRRFRLMHKARAKMLA